MASNHGDYLSDHVNLIINSSLLKGEGRFDSVPSPSSSSQSLSWEPSPSYHDFLVGSFNYFHINIASMFYSDQTMAPDIVKSNLRDRSFIENLVVDSEKCLENISFTDINIIIILAIFWTMLRYVSDTYIFKVCS